MKKLLFLLLCMSPFMCITCQEKDDNDYMLQEVKGRWSVERINDWYNKQPWIVGANYTPATAINQIEMWQASTWDPTTIKKELSWAAGLGMNSLRVFLHDRVWAADKKGLYKRMDEFLDICKGYNIRPWFVFFDDCHFPHSQLGEQPLPVIGYHNSGWVNCPDRSVAIRYAKGTASKQEVKQLKGYVQETMARFKNDDRVLMWELYNEPGRGRGDNGDMAAVDGVPAMIGDLSNKLVYDSWVWAREINPSQPITSCTFGSVGKRNVEINRTNSDLHSIHSYSKGSDLRKTIVSCQENGRPVVVTEWLARPSGSTVQDCLPVMKEMKVGAMTWGFVSGKTATIWPWSSRVGEDKKAIDVKQMRKEGKVVRPGEPFPEPEVWFHDLFRTDGTPFDQEEVEVFRQCAQKQ